MLSRVSSANQLRYHIHTCRASPYQLWCHTFHLRGRLRYEQEKPGIIHVTKEDQYRKLVSHPGITFVDYYADWCGPCKAISPLIEKMALQYSESRILKVGFEVASSIIGTISNAQLSLLIPFPQVNVDTQQAIAASEGIQAMPTFKLFKNGILAEEFRGADPRKIQNALLSAHPSS